MKSKTIIIVEDHLRTDNLYVARMIEQHGSKVILLTPQEAEAQGLKMDDITLPTIPYTAPVCAMRPEVSKSGKEARRHRRHQERLKGKVV